MPHHKWSQKQWLGMLFYLPVSCLLPVAEQGAALQAEVWGHHDSIGFDDW